jgi:adenylate cyclase
MSLNHLWREQEREEDAREVLADVHRKFTEGFDTCDVRNARALLESLA